MTSEFKRYECANTECFAVGILWKREATVPVRDHASKRLLYRSCPVCNEPVKGAYYTNKEIDKQWLLATEDTGIPIGDDPGEK